MEDKSKPTPDNKTVFKPRKQAEQKPSVDESESSQAGQVPPKAEESSSKPSEESQHTVFKPRKPLAKAAQNIEQAPKSKEQPPKAKPVDGTVVKPRSPKPKAANKPADAKAQQSKQAKPQPKQNVAELTRIQKSIREQDSSKGFVLAKQTADEALSQNKIMLNNRFVLESTLGGGGMGTVYKAKDLRKVEASDLKPYVAVKVLNEDFKNHPHAFITLQREASRSHILSHPNIVTVHDFDRDGDIIFMTMELLEGQSMDVFLRQHRTNALSLADAAPMLEDLCNALAFAHKKGIVHSDLKPGNIFVTDEGCKVLDFGIARLVNDASEDFDAGELGALTPPYASLEMIEGEPPAAEDDIYALAVITYEMLTGKHPFDRKSAEEAQKLGLKPEKIVGLSKQEWSALESALAFKREQRTHSVEEFQQKLLHKQRFPIFKAVSALLFVVTTGLGAMFYFAPDKVDQVAQETMLNGQQCFEQQQYDCAIDAFKTVLELHPNHQEAKQLLQATLQTKKDQAIEAATIALANCLNSQQDVVCAKSELNQLTNLEPDAAILANAQQQIQQFEKRQRFAALLKEADSCFAENQFDCAHEALDKILADAEQHEAALALKADVTARQQQLASDNAARDQRFNSALSKGEGCLKKKDYSCAINAFEQAIKIKPSNTKARELAQTAQFEKKTAEQNQQRADAFIAKAQACLDRKNYTCAISNAESSLEILPSYKPATALRDKAKTELENIKKSFSIN